jgi:hypothetical protein
MIRGKAGPSEIVLTTTTRLAGAIHCLTWNGREFVDSTDHGRQLQSAASFDCASGPPFHAESYIPTEAGSRADGAGPTSTSRILGLEARRPELRTRTRDGAPAGDYRYRMFVPVGTIDDVRQAFIALARGFGRTGD